jgi:hypothetical protein
MRDANADIESVRQSPANDNQGWQRIGQLGSNIWENNIALFLA